MSTRSREVRELAEAYGSDSQKARRIAALASRQRKQVPADYDALEAKWSDTLSHWGFSSEHERALHNRVTVAEFRHGSMRLWISTGSDTDEPAALGTGTDMGGTMGSISPVWKDIHLPAAVAPPLTTSVRMRYIVSARIPAMPGTAG